MVRTNSNFVALGSNLPSFNLLNANSPVSQNYSFSDLDERHLLLFFICAHCPFVKYVEPEISRIQQDIEVNFQLLAIHILYFFENFQNTMIIFFLFLCMIF